MKQSTDFLVIGTGLAGLSFALKAAELGQVLICTKTQLGTTNTAMAQGGIASVTSSEDSFENHIQDTLTAGSQLNNPDVVRRVVEQAPQCIHDLVEWGVQFDKDESGQFCLTREGGHSSRRILHIADHTGSGIHKQLLKKALEHPRIEMLEEHFAIDLILNKDIEPYNFAPPRCIGAYILNKLNSEVVAVRARAVALATGGAGKVYRYTSNWSGATGDGIAMAFRAGARVANLEFMQFHPTCLYHPESRNFLISEAVRGEGGELINSRGQAFMTKYHPRGSLAPRDIVARSIDAEMKRSGDDCVYLDVSHKPAEFIKNRFPQIYARCKDLGIDMTQQPIPVVPAAHYLCGGVLAGVDGNTDVQGLYALGETACSGLHGANRLASNSLLECLVFSSNAVKHIQQQLQQLTLVEEPLPSWHLHDKEDPDELIVVSHMWEEIRSLMWNYVGIVRSNRRLERAEHRLTNILNEIQEYYSNFKTHSDIVELRNIATVADLTVKCALNRKHSLGIHYNLDYEFYDYEKSGRPKDTILTPANVLL